MRWFISVVYDEMCWSVRIGRLCASLGKTARNSEMEETRAEEEKPQGTRDNICPDSISDPSARAQPLDSTPRADSLPYHILPLASREAAAEPGPLSRPHGWTPSRVECSRWVSPSNSTEAHKGPLSARIRGRGSENNGRRPGAQVHNVM